MFTVFVLTNHFFKVCNSSIIHYNTIYVNIKRALFDKALFVYFFVFISQSSPLLRA
jgi:hypothetical protein